MKAAKPPSRQKKEEVENPSFLLAAWRLGGFFNHLSIVVSMVACTPQATTDGGTDGGDGGMCGVVLCEQCTTDAGGYSPIVQGTPTTVMNACTTGELQAFVTACFSSGATTASCTAWNMLDAGADAGACAQCLAAVTETSPTWGPFVCATTASPCGANSGGCVDIVLGTVNQEMRVEPDGGVGSCGDQIANAFACEDYTCSTCRGTDTQACLDDAVATQCATWAQAQTSTTGLCAAANGAAAPAALASCFPKADVENVAFVNVFCGTGG